MQEIQIYEVEETNLLYIVTDRNQDATYYNKKNLRVEAVDEYVVIWNNDIEFFQELPRDFVDPLESSVVDLVEIIQGYIDNLLPENEDELDALKELLDAQNETTSVLELIRIQLKTMVDVLKQQKITNKHLEVLTEVEWQEHNIEK